MKIQDTGAASQQVTPPSPYRPKRSRWLAGVGAIIVVILVVGLSALVFAQLRQRQAGQSTPTPPTAQWKQVLKGYTLASLVAARSDPAVLYACAIRETPGTNAQSDQGVITILRTADFGDHWQEVGGSAVLGNTCQLAVNPTDSNDIYAVSNVSNSQNPGLLKHSTDGGQTWQTILPVMHVPSLQTAVQWSVQQIQIEGNHLFGMQWITPRPVPVSPPSRPILNLLPRLVTSVDGGHNWIVIDNQFATQRLGVHSYAVDPTNPSTIYDLVGASLFPLELVPTNDPLPFTGLNQELFKTTNSGATWQMILNNIPYGSQVQLAAGNPQVLYVGGTLGPLPLARGIPQPSYPIVIGSFHLQMSTNGGSNWQNVAIPADMQSIQNWYVSPVGQVFASPTIPFTGQPTAVAGTAIPATVLPFPTGNPQSVGADLSGTSPIYRPASLVAVHTLTTPVASSQFIRRYDPTTNSWSNVTRSPTQGFMLQLTSAQTNSGAILWFVGIADKGQVLYRYVV